MAEENRPLSVTVIDDYDLVVAGVAALLAPHGDLVHVVERDTDGELDRHAEVALLDCFALAGGGAAMIADLADHPKLGCVVVYTWATAPELVDAAFGAGARGFVSKGLAGRELAEALVAAHRGECPVLVERGTPEADLVDQRDPDARRWPGAELGLTERESEVLALITQGLRRAEIAEALYLGIDAIKTHTRTLYRKIGVTSRTEAAVFGIDHGFRPDRSSRQEWSG